MTEKKRRRNWVYRTRDTRKRSGERVGVCWTVGTEKSSSLEGRLKVRQDQSSLRQDGSWEFASSEVRSAK